MNDIPEGYKMSEVGVIPEEWTVNTLENVCVKKGLVRGPFGGALKKEFFVRGGIKVYEQKNAIYRNANLGNYFISKNKFNELKRFEVKYGDFILSCSGTIGKIYQIPKGAECGIINQALLKIKTNDNIIHDEFFFYYFDWEKFQEKIIDNTQGGAMQNLVGMDIFRNTQIPLSPLPEQQAIASALSDVDALITALEQLITKKRNIKQGAMRQLLTGKKRLPGFSGEWEVIIIAEKSVLKARIGWQGLTTAEYLKNGEYYLVTGTDFMHGKINWNCCHFVNKNRYVQDKNIQLKNNDVLITKDGTIGKVGYVDNLPGKATLNSGVFVIRPREKIYDPLFFYYVLKSCIFDNFMRQLQAGSTISHLYQKDFVNFGFSAPPLPEQQAIAQILSDMDTEIETLEQKRDKYKVIKQGMMQELLTGKTRLVVED